MNLSGDQTVPQILIVDDEPELRIVLKEVIENLGCTCLEAGKATEALSLIKKFRVDLLLLDIQMQGASGIDMLKVLRRRHLHIPTIVISGYITQGIATELATLGVQGVVAKPFTPTRLTQEIHKILHPATAS